MGEDMIGDSSFVFADENHLSVIPAALMRGLREVGALR
jgi:hypothetical protein